MLGVPNLNRLWGFGYITGDPMKVRKFGQEFSWWFPCKHVGTANSVDPLSVDIQNGRQTCLKLSPSCTHLRAVTTQCNMFDIAVTPLEQKESQVSQEPQRLNYWREAIFAVTSNLAQCEKTFRSQWLWQSDVEAGWINTIVKVYQYIVDCHC